MSLNRTTLNRAYQSTTPTASAILKQRWDERRYKIHRDKVYTVKSYVDNKSPKTYLHLTQRLKKYVMEEQRMASIQRDNYILLSKMAIIMQSKGTIDNWNDYKILSLNGGARQRELVRIAQENQAILARIESQEPYYNTAQWEQEWRDAKTYMAFIAKFPHAGTYHRQRFRTRRVCKYVPPERTGTGKSGHMSALQSAYKETTPNPKPAAYRETSPESSAYKGSSPKPKASGSPKPKASGSPKPK